jgi:hypothetical protein
MPKGHLLEHTMKQKAFTVIAILFAGGAGACFCQAHAADKDRPRYVSPGEGPYWPAAKREAGQSNAPNYVQTVRSQPHEGELEDVQYAPRGQRDCATDPTCVYVPLQSSSKWEDKRSIYRAKKLRGPLPTSSVSVKKSGVSGVKTGKPTIAVATVTPRLTAKAPPAAIQPPPAKSSSVVAGLTDRSVSADLSKACTSKDPNACLVLGRMYATGNGVAKNEGVAVQRYTQSCDLGNGTACYALGVIYEIGAGAKSDGVKAQKFYQLACSRGNSVACESAKRPAQKAKKTWKLGIFGL